MIFYLCDGINGQKSADSPAGNFSKENTKIERGYCFFFFRHRLIISLPSAGPLSNSLSVVHFLLPQGCQTYRPQARTGPPKESSLNQCRILQSLNVITVAFLYNDSGVRQSLGKWPVYSLSVIVVHYIKRKGNI